MTFRSRIGRRMTVALALFCLLFLAVPVSLAFDGRTDDVVTIGADEVVDDDLYVGAQELIIDGVVKGDVFAGGTKVTVNGTIEGDLFAGGQHVVINGTVADDVRAGGTLVEVNGTIGGDLLAGGQGIDLKAGSSVGGDVLAGGMFLNFAGDIGRNVRVGALGLAIDGAVGGDVKASVGSSADAPPFDPTMFDPTAPDLPEVAAGLTLGENAEIAGNLEYETIDSVEISADAVNGDIIFNQVEVEAAEEVPVTRRVGLAVWNAVQLWLVLMLIAWVVMQIWPRFLDISSHHMSNNWVGTLGWGLLFVIMFPILLTILFVVIMLLASLLGAITLNAIAGIVVGLGIVALIVEFVIYLFIFGLFSKLMVGHILGKRLLGANQRPMVPLAVGTLIIVILCSLPFVGGLISFLVSLLGFGTLWYMWSNRKSISTAVEKSAMPV